jgi:hypothetical protein
MDFYYYGGLDSFLDLFLWRINENRKVSQNAKKKRMGPGNAKAKALLDFSALGAHFHRF